jgi:16S rRNA processing protein RimM
MSGDTNRQAEGAAAILQEEAGAEWVILGRISGLYGVRGWVRVYSHTSPRDNILDYSPWYLQRAGRWEKVKLKEGRVQGKGVVVQLEGYTDRDRAAELLQCDIAIRYDQLPALRPDEYYWADLEGLRVQTTEGIELGVVDHLFETGANDVMVVKGDRERLIPFLQQDVIHKIDLEAGLVVVDWDPEF